MEFGVEFPLFLNTKISPLASDTYADVTDSNGPTTMASKAESFEGCQMCIMGACMYKSYKLRELQR
jgi:hypothetical protein